MKLTAKAEAEARALGVVVDLIDVKSRLERQAPPWVEGHRTVRLGRPSRARVVLDGADDLVAVLPSSPHAEAGVPDVRGGNPDRKRARDQERWERRQSGRPAPGGRRHGLEPEGEAEATLLRLGAVRLAWLREEAGRRDVSVAQVVRDLVDKARGQ